VLNKTEAALRCLVSPSMRAGVCPFQSGNVMKISNNTGDRVLPLQVKYRCSGKHQWTSTNSYFRGFDLLSLLKFETA
jgi:hypothetical protein